MTPRDADLAYFEDLAAERAEREEQFEPLAVARGEFREMGAKTRQVIHSEYTYALNHGRAA